MISMAIHWSLTLTLLFENKRKDFGIMLTHHVVTVLCNSITWICNLHRAACLITFVHYCVDWILDIGRALNYAKCKRTFNVLFCIHTITWIITRFIVFPRIIYECMLFTYKTPYPVTIILSGMLAGLMILHIIWTYGLFQLIARSLKIGEIKGDVKSDSDDLGFL